MTLAVLRSTFSRAASTFCSMPGVPVILLRWTMTPNCSVVRPNSPNIAELLATQIWWKRRAAAVGMACQAGAAPAVSRGDAAARLGCAGCLAMLAHFIIYNDSHII